MDQRKAPATETKKRTNSLPVTEAPALPPVNVPATFTMPPTENVSIGAMPKLPTTPELPPQPTTVTPDTNTNTPPFINNPETANMVPPASLSGKTLPTAGTSNDHVYTVDKPTFTVETYTGPVTATSHKKKIAAK